MVGTFLLTFPLDYATVCIHSSTSLQRFFLEHVFPRIQKWTSGSMSSKLAQNDCVRCLWTLQATQPDQFIINNRFIDIVRGLTCLDFVSSCYQQQVFVSITFPTLRFILFPLFSLPIVANGLYMCWLYVHWWLSTCPFFHRLLHFVFFSLVPL